MFRPTLVLFPAIFSGCIQPTPPPSWTQEAEIQIPILEGRLRSALGLPRGGQSVDPGALRIPNGYLDPSPPPDSLQSQLEALLLEGRSM